MYLVFDTETNGLPKSFSAPIGEAWPRIVQIAWQLCDDQGNIVEEEDIIINPDFIISEESIRIHRITNEIAKEKGIPISKALEKFSIALEKATHTIAHNHFFDEKVVLSEFKRIQRESTFKEKEIICTMQRTTLFCKIINGNGYKWPNLQELHKKLFEENFEQAHNALVDVNACRKCFFELKKRRVL